MAALPVRTRARAIKRPSAAVGALAIGALAFGALAVGAIAIGALAVRRLGIGRARFGTLEIDHLTVGRLSFAEPRDPAQAREARKWARSVSANRR
jgi:hypothetical protein